MKALLRCTLFALMGLLLQPVHITGASAVEDIMGKGLEKNLTMADGLTVKNVQEYLGEFIGDYKRVRSHSSKTQMRQISTVGLVSGLIRVEDLMNAYLTNITQEFLHKFDAATVDQVLEQLLQLEQTMDRDKKAIDFLCNALDVARSVKSFDDFKDDIEEMMVANEIATMQFVKKREATKMARTSKALGAGNETTSSDAALKAELKNKLSDMVTNIEQHLKRIHRQVKTNAKDTIRFLRANVSPKNAMGSFEAFGEDVVEHKAIGSNQLSLMSKLISGRFRRQGTDPATTSQSDEMTNRSDMNKDKEIDNEIMPAKQQAGEDEDSESESMESGPGGLVGLIGSLSGGDEGSDIGALIGALTGVITNLFGPNGLDIESLLGTGTSLIAGLLGGDENFGKVLGGYVGIALDGLSGGGGAINQGQFFGQFLGTVIAYLSADPEDDDLPLKPKLFIENVFSGSKTATAKAGAEEAEKPPAKPNGGSDFFGFIGNIVGSIVAGVTSLIVNSSVGSSGGSSQGSADLIGGSSAASSAGSNAKPHHHHPHPAAE